VTSEQFEVAKAKLDDAGIDYLGPDRGADDSMYFRDPNGLGLELYREVLGRFEGSELL
jgi:glyoxylase I family protein